MTPKQIYDLPPIRIDNEVSSFCEFMGIDYCYDLDKNKEKELESKFKLKYYANHSYDGERCWTLFSVWFDYVYPNSLEISLPFMLCQKAGRGGRDHTENYITNSKVFKAAKEFINSFFVKEEIIPTFSEDKELPAATEFYSNKLEDFYSNDLNPKYKVDDIVNANVYETNDIYNFRKRKKVVTRVKILSVDKFSPYETYHGLQLDRLRTSTYNPYSETITESIGNGNIYCDFCDIEVVE